MNPLVGREHILSTLGSHLDATLQGSGSCVIVDGPFGIGKTHLLKATAMEAVERGLTVVAGRTSITDQPIPIHLLINFLRHVHAGEGDFDDLMGPDRNPFWLMDRVGELVESASRRHPLMVVLDDAQRVDDVSALALRGLVRSLASSPVLWLLARRPVATQSLAQHVVDWLIDHAAVQLHLGTLDHESVAELCTSFVGAKPDATVLSWAARCGGNPWLMENVFSALIKAGQMIITDGTASVVAERLPEGVVAAVHRLLGEMSPAVRRLLVDGGRIGHTFTVEQAAAAIGEPTFDLPSAVDEAVQMGLMRRDGMELTFTHQVVGEALAHNGFRAWEPAVTAPPPVAVAGPAAARGVPAAPVVTSPAAPARASVCGCEETAARAIASLERGFDEASRTLARALRLLAGAGRGAEACRLADVALRRGIEATAEAQLVHELGQGLRDTDSHGMAAELLARTLARQDVCELDRAKLNRVLADTAKRVAEVPVQGLAGSGPRIAAGATTTATAPWRGEPASRRHCDTCERPLWTWLVRALVAADHGEEAAAVLAAVKDVSPASLWYGHRAELLVAAGRLDEARAEAETALRLADRSAPEDSVPARLVLARVSMHDGDLATASDQLRMTERLMSDDATADKARLDWALARFHAASDRPAMMVQTLINIDGQVVPDQLLFTETPAAAASLIRQARQVGLGAEAELAAEFARRIARRNPTVQALAAAAEHAEGVLRNDAAALHRAAELYRLAGRPLAAGSALEDAARVEQSTRDKVRAVRLLESAMAVYAGCGARRDVDRVRQKLPGLDAHNVRRLAVERPKSGWESLTTAELRVVRAIVDGRTNREAASVLFLSPHTVDTHLRRVFSKLAINSRVELTKRFIAHEAFPPLMVAAHQPGSAG
ncbi:AAA family ATPase [Phytohabitans houttuyneae]|uniref:Helix-turn-helix transcriptional regulator n=1 Tax=Phytohabitans houttuyneae TaxID=1076126 RepID=A0A6V8K1Y7_9ACTN|nr:AAA family ATPase [Phytohabitans houttuyneae]GFJ76381.1 helix-turn-helix transcriptional regulator [Phytohabitans houttuyneae]